MTNKYNTPTLESLMIIRQSKVLLGARVAIVHLCFVLITTVFFIFTSAPDVWSFLTVLLAVGFVEMIVLFYAVIRWHNHYNMLRSDRILTSRGVFLRRQRLFAIKNIESISVRQGIIGKIFNFGTLHLYAPTLNHQIKMLGVNDPCHKEKIIEELLPNAINGEQRLRNLFIAPENRSQAG